MTQGSIAEIRGRAGGSRVSFVAEALPPDLEGAAVVRDGRVVLEAEEPEELVRRLVHAGAALHGLEVTPLPLEHALRRLPGNSS